MKKNLFLAIALISLSGCTSLSEQDPERYQAALSEAKTILKSRVAIKRFKEYYDDKNHKAFAQSKVNTTSGHSSYESSVELAKNSALELCHLRLLKKYKEITEEVSCEIVNIDNQWINKQ